MPRGLIFVNFKGYNLGKSSLHTFFVICKAGWRGALCSLDLIMMERILCIFSYRVNINENHVSRQNNQGKEGLHC